MRVLWTVNTHNPKIASQFSIKASHASSWVEAMSERLAEREEVQLAIAAPASVDKLEKQFINGITYYAVPVGTKAETSWQQVITDFAPEIIHEYGTEKDHNLIVSKLAGEIPVIVSLQGLLKEYERHYYGGIDMSTILRYTPLRDILRPSGFITGRRDFCKRAVFEVALLRSVTQVEGRSTWDRVAAMAINPDLKYYFCPRMIRSAFYNAEPWDVAKIKRHTVFVSQGNYPIKGLHFVLEALAVLKKRYPDVKLVVTGSNMFANMTGVQRILKPGYQRYLFDLANKLNIMEHIEFVGFKDAEGMAEMLQNVHISLVPSAIENAPNSLSEAMLVGTPSVASFVGGNMDMLAHGKEGFLYCYNEPNMLAEYIHQIFVSDERACSFSAAARQTARARHDPQTLVTTILQIYTDVINGDD